MLQIEIPYYFTAERKYIVDVLPGHFLALNYEVRETDREDYCIILPNGKSLRFLHYNTCKLSTT